jgi:predicted dehydrogenase
MAKIVNWAVLGLGIGNHHCQAVTMAKGARLVAVCDHDEERLEKARTRFDVRGYSHWQDLLKDDEVDVISICTESGTHATFAVDAARAGKHIVVEKPLDVTPARIKKIREAVRATGVKCTCMLQTRLDPCNFQIKKKIDAGKMGDIIGVHGSLPWFRPDSYYEGPHGEWKGTWKLDGGGSLINQGIHTIDLMQWFAGPVEEVSAYCGVFTHDIEAEDQTAAILKFDNGALGTLVTTTCANPGAAQRIHMYGSKGSLVKRGPAIERYDMGTKREQATMLERFAVKEKADAGSSDPMAIAAAGHLRIIQDMADAIRKGRDPFVTLEGATHSVEIICAIYKSAKTGKSIKVAKLRK